MSSASMEIQRNVVVRNRSGLHARPAAEFVKLASRFRADIVVRKADVEVSGKSILGVMMLAAEYGSELTIRASGEDAEEAIRQLAELIENTTDEE